MLARFALLTLLSFAVSPAPALETQERLDSLLQTGLNPAECYRVRDLFLEREDIKLYLTDGYLIFSEARQGRPVAALFIAERPEDSGEIVLIPPTPRERQSVLQFTGESVLSERFRNALMLFSDDTATVLRQGIEDSPSSKLEPAAGERLSSRWSSVLRNILQGAALRLMGDFVSDIPAEDGFFAAAIGGGRLGRFDVVYDPRRPEQVSVGQAVTRDRQQFYEIWAQFAARSFRSGRRESRPAEARLENYDIDTTIAEDLSMQVVARADFIPSDNRYRAFALSLSRSLYVDEILLDGEPIEVLQVSRTTGNRIRDEESLFFVLPEFPQADRPLRLEVRYGGELISRAGEGVFYVSNRANWYPTSDRTFSHLRLTFHYPAELDLVATGKRLSDEEADGVRTSVFETDFPARLAGFNLGQYLTAERRAGDYPIEVRANRNVQESLKPKAPSVIYFPNTATRNRRFTPPRVMLGPTPPTPPSPADRIDAVADRAAEAFEYFIERFGPPPTANTVISPIPAGFGQGFPGLVYASTLSYYNVDDPPLNAMPASQQTFYSKLLLPHEISHQWWGNAVAVDSPSDNWVLEALATYSSLLFVEAQEGVAARDQILADFRSNLLTENEDGDHIESAGPLVLGDRLRSSRFPSAYRVILYDKGSWVIHMLRGVLGDEAFFQLLRDLPDRRRGQYIDVEDFREIAASYLPESARDRELRDFFDQWVYNTGVPRLSIDWKHKDGVLTGTLSREDAPPHAVFSVPVRVRLESGESFDLTILSEEDETDFELPVTGKAAEVLIDPAHALLRQL